jgi:acyl carrier protein
MTGAMGGADTRRVAALGIHPVEPDEGLALLDAALAHGGSLLVPARPDIAALRALDAAVTPPPLRDLVRRTTARPLARAAAPAAPLTRMSPAELHAHLLGLVRSHAATVLGHSTGEAIGEDREFKKLGFDSLTAVELRNRLQGATGLRLPATLVFDHPTPAGLADHLGQELAPKQAAPDLLAEVGRLEEAVRAADADAETREAVADRLHALLRDWGVPTGNPSEDDLSTASDDDLFSVIENELGIS